MALQIALFHMSFNPIEHVSFGWLTSYFQMGAVAMTGFFMVSGFIMEIKYEGASTFDHIKAFYTKRFVAIIPLYYAVMIFHKLVISKDGITVKLIMLPFEVLGIQSWVNGLFSYGSTSGTWFVSCILFCYVLFPLLSKILDNVAEGDLLTCKDALTKKRILVIIGFGIYLILAFTPVMVKTVGIYDNPLFRMMEFYIGMLIAKLRQSAKKEKAE